MSLISSMVSSGPKKGPDKKKRKDPRGPSSLSLLQLSQLKINFAPPGLGVGENVMMVWNHNGDMVFERISDAPLPTMKGGYSLNDALAMQKVASVLRKTHKTATKDSEVAKLVAISQRLGKTVPDREQMPAQNYASIVKPARQFLVNLRKNMDHIRSISPDVFKSGAEADEGIVGLFARGIRDTEHCLGERITAAVTDHGDKIKSLHELTMEVETPHSLITMLCKADWASRATDLKQLIYPRKREAGIKLSTAEIQAGKMDLLTGLLDRTFFGLASFLASTTVVEGFVEEKMSTTAGQRRLEQLRKVQMLLQFKETAEEIRSVPKLQLPSVGTCVMYPALCRGLTTALYRMRAGFSPFGADQSKVATMMGNGFVFASKSSDSFRDQYVNFATAHPGEATATKPISGEVLDALIVYAGVGSFWPHHGLVKLFPTFASERIETDRVKVVYPEEKEGESRPVQAGTRKCIAAAFPSKMENKQFLASFKADAKGVYPDEFQRYIPNYDPEKEARKRAKKGQRAYRVYGMSDASERFIETIMNKRSRTYKGLYPIVNDISSLLTSIENETAQKRTVKAIKAQWTMMVMYAGDGFIPEEEFREERYTGPNYGEQRSTTDSDDDDDGDEEEEEEDLND